MTSDLRYAVWYHRDNGSIRSSECVVFDVMDRDPKIIVEALGGALILQAASGTTVLHGSTIESVIDGIGRRLGAEIYIPSPPIAARASSHRQLDHALKVTAHDAAIRSSVFAYFVKTASEWWYGRAAIEMVYDEFHPITATYGCANRTQARDMFVTKLAMEKRAEFYQRLLDKSVELATWEKERGPHGHRGLAILPRENVAKHPEGRHVIWDPRAEPVWATHHDTAAWIHDRLFQWLPEERRFRHFQHKADDLLVAVELQ